MKRELAERDLEWIKEGENSRQVVVDEALVGLCASIVENGLLQPVGVIDHGTHGTLFIGFRRFGAIRYGVSQGLEMPAKIPVMLYPPDMTPEAEKVAQITENLQRQDLTDPQKFQAVADLVGLGLSLDEIATALGKSKPSICRYRAPDHCPPEAKEYFLAGRLTLGHMYKISQATNPLAVMKVFLRGGTHEQAEAADKPQGKTGEDDNSNGKAIRVRIPMVVGNDDYSGKGVVTITTPSGEEFDWDGAEHLLKDAITKIKEAKKRNWAIATAQNTWRDMAAGE